MIAISTESEEGYVTVKLWFRENSHIYTLRDGHENDIN